MITVSTPRNDVILSDGPNAFLGGTIDLGNSRDWQQLIISWLNAIPLPRNDVNLFNPRRVCFVDDVDEIEYQINWELHHIAISDVMFMNFEPNSLSPISLLELGLCLGSGQPIIVVCPTTYFRYSNVKETCDFYGVEIYNTLEEGFGLLTKFLFSGAQWIDRQANAIDSHLENERHYQANVKELNKSLKAASNRITELDAVQIAIDAQRYRKLQKWMSSNVHEGWNKVENMGAICAWEGWDAMDEYLDNLPECNVGLRYQRQD